MAEVTGLTRGGTTWIPQFVESIDLSRCIGCGRCLKACGRQILRLLALNEDGEFVEDEEEEEIERKVMTIAHPELCIGCEACARVCPKDCYTHSPV